MVALGVLVILALAGCATPAAPVALANGIVLAAISESSGSLSGGTTVVLTGENLTEVTGVDFGAVQALSVSHDRDSLIVVTPPSVDFAAESVPISLFWEGDSGAPTGLVFSYRVETPVDAQMNYLLEHWDTPNAMAFGRLNGTDCVNFASQGLLARGWSMTPDWWHAQASGVNQYGRPWISSTAFMNWLADHPELAVEVDQADAVIGDIAQFDYDNVGGRNHTGTVSKIAGEGAEREVFVVQHNKDADYSPVAEMLASHGPQAKVYYWHPVG